MIRSSMDMEPPLDNFIKTELYISFNYLKICVLCNIYYKSEDLVK